MSTKFDDEFSFKDCLKFLFRNKKILLFFTALGILITSVNIISSKDIWEGEIKILLQNNNSENNNKRLLKLYSRDINNVQTLSTQLEILKSPLVLLPVYNFINSEKLSLNPNYSPPTFNSWVKGNLDISLVENTSVLNITLFDTEKSLIIPVLEKITEEYKKYPIKNKTNSNEILLTSLRKKINEAEKISMISDLDRDNFSKTYKIYLSNLENNFSIDSSNANNNLDVSIKNQKFNLMETIDLTTNYESNKFESERENKVLNDKLDLINKLDENFDLYELIYIFPRIQNDLLAKEISIESNILERKKQIFRPNDKEIKKLKRILSIKKLNLKKKTISLISTIIEENNSIILNSDIPKDIINKYKKLSLKAYHDKYRLNQLENSYLNASLNLPEEPWKTISKPTLLNDPINNNKQIFIKYFITTFLLGLLITISLEIFRDKIYDDNSLRKLLNKKIFTTINKNSQESWQEEIAFIKKSFENHEKSLYLSIDKNSLISDLIINNLKIHSKKQLNFSEDLLDIYEFKNTFIFITEDLTTNLKIKETIRKISAEFKENIEFILLK